MPLSPTQNQFSAADSALGYLYQARVALLWSLKRLKGDAEFLVSLETLDDVTFESKGRPEELLQTKHHITRAATLTDASTDLWKTLRVWVEGTLNDSIPRQTLLYMVTTSIAAPNSSSAKLMSEGRDVESALASLETTAQTSSSRENAPAYAAFLNMPISERRALVNRIVILDQTPAILDLNGTLKAEIGWATERRHQDTFLQYLEGWWFRRFIVQMARINTGDRILGQELEAQMSNLREQFKQDSLPIADDLLNFTPDDAAIAAHDESVFVKQMELVKANKRRVAAAIRDYLNMAREGRAIQFPERIRSLTLKLLLLWEETMLQGGVLDELSLTLALLPSRSKLKDLATEKRFRCLLVDEVQDLSTLDLILLRQIPTESLNGFFVAGDTVQKVLVKSLKLQSVGLDIINAKWEKINKNYRNSRQILQAASNLVYLYGDKAKMLGEEIEILDPEFAVRETGKPLAMQVIPQEELSEAWRLAKECVQSQTAIPWSVCLVTACPQKISPNQILMSMPKDFPIKANQITGDYTRTKDTMSVGTVTDVKGFEFSMVIIVGCGESTLPNPVACTQEAWREAFRLYVAMTRARDSVIMLYSGKPSEFLLAMKQDLRWINSNPPSN